MKANENQKSTREYKVYIHRLKTWVDVTEEQYYAYYRDIWATRKRAQAHGRCMCPKTKIWMCDGDCLVCEFRAAGDTLSLDYAAYVVELLETAKQTCSDPVVMIEQRVNFTRWVQDGFGTADCLLIADGTLNVIDMKFGRGIEVSAIKKPQMMLYALGALEIFDDIYDIGTVRMTIYQPRKSNVSVYELPKADLLEWADTELTQKAKLAFEGQGDFHCGEWCRFCKAKAECRERAEANLALARYDFEAPALLDDSEIADILSKVDALTTWASDVKEYALQQAISGKEWTGWKLVEGRSNRKYTSEAAVATAVEGIGFDPYERKVLGITAMQKLLGKSRFEELLTPYIEKPQGKPTLVPESDKRPAYEPTQRVACAKNDFMEEF